MTDDMLDQLEAMASKIALRDGDEEMAVVPVLVAKIKRLREELRDTHTKVFHLEVKLAWMERERDQLTSLPAERVLAALREPSEKLLGEVDRQLFAQPSVKGVFFSRAIRIAVAAAEREVNA